MEPNVESTKSGMLMKRGLGQYFKPWAVRLFKFYSSEVSVTYETLDHGIVKGKLRLEKSKPQIIILPISENKPYAFQVTVRKFIGRKISPFSQQLILAAKSNEDRSDWISALNIGIQDYYVGRTMNQIVSIDSGILKWADANAYPEVLLVFNGMLGDLNEPNSSGRTPLICAVQQNNIKIVSVLLEKNADVNKIDENWQSPLMHAAASNHTAISNLLISRGAKTSQIDKANRRNSTATATATTSLSNIEVTSDNDVEIDGTFPNPPSMPPPCPPPPAGPPLSSAPLALDSAAMEIDNETLMAWAIENGYPDVYKVSSGQQGNLDEVNEALMESPAIVWAAYGDNNSVVQALVHYGAATDGTDKNGYSALAWASNLGNEEMAQFLIQRGAEVNAPTKDGSTCLILAAQEGHIDIVKLLLAKGGAYAHAVDGNGRTARMYAAMNNYLDIVGEIPAVDIQDGRFSTLVRPPPPPVPSHTLPIDIPTTLPPPPIPDFRPSDMDDDSFIYSASVEYYSQDISMSSSLNLSVGFFDLYSRPSTFDHMPPPPPLPTMSTLPSANDDTKNQTHENTKTIANISQDLPESSSSIPLMLEWAIECDFKQLVSFLSGQKQNIDINAPSTKHFGSSPLVWAAHQRRIDILAGLLHFGADINALDKNHFGSLSWAAIQGNTEMVKVLLENNAKIDIGLQHGQTPLHLAVQGGHFQVVKCLVDAEADVDVVDKFGQTALNYSSSENHVDITTLLVSVGARVNICDQSGTTPLMSASQENNLELVILLLDKGADIDAVDENGQSALIHASAQGHADIIEALIGRGASVDILDIDGNKALHYSNLSFEN